MADAVSLLTGNQRGTVPTERVEYDAIAHAVIQNWVGHQIHRLHIAESSDEAFELFIFLVAGFQILAGLCSAALSCATEILCISIRLLLSQ